MKMNKTRIAVISDSHDNVDKLTKAINTSNQKECSYLFHLGDIISPFTAEKLAEFKGEVIAVFGNCDGDKIGLNRAFAGFGGSIDIPPLKIEVNNTRIVLMHEPVLIEELSESEKLDYIFFGHLHKETFYTNGKTKILNPGETAGLVSKSTFYIVDLGENAPKRIVL